MREGRSVRKELTMIHRIMAAALIMLGMMMSQASAAQMPDVDQVKPVVSGGFSPILPLAEKQDAAKPIQVASRRWRRRAAGAAIALGILGIAAAVAAKEARRERHYYDDYDRECHKWLRRCDRGNDRACYKFDRYCH